MTRRSAAHDYTRPGLYHITMHVAESLGQPLGAVVGSLSVPDDSTDAPHTVLTPVGRMVEQELLHSISAHYPMMEVQDHVIMPEHIHFIVEAHSAIVTQNGKKTSLGQVIAGFKKGCNRRYWEMTNQQGKPVGTVPAGSPVVTVPAGSPVVTVPAGLPSGCKVPSNASTGRQPLFSEGYCDVMPLDAAQLETQRTYIKGNPRSRLLRMNKRDSLTVKRGTITTALTPAALRGFLQRVCLPHQAPPDVLAAIEARLLTAPAVSVPSGSPAGSPAVSVPSGFPAGGICIACDTFGNRALLAEHRCLPVVCHRKDAARFAEQKTRCLDEAAKGTVLVSACISPREREIISDSVHHGFPVIVIHDNGFPDRYHPSAERLDLCASDCLLLVSPWQYRYRGHNEQVTVPFCKAMNCVAQALCRTRDDWWQ